MEGVWQVEEAGKLMQCHPVTGQDWNSLATSRNRFERKYEEAGSDIARVGRWMPMPHFFHH